MTPTMALESTPAEEGSQGNVGDHSTLDGSVKSRAHVASDGFQRKVAGSPGSRGRYRWAPVGLDPSRVIPLNGEDVARSKALDASKERAGGGYIPKRQVGRDGLWVKLTGDLRVGQHGLDLTAEDDTTALLPVVEGLLTQAVPSDDETTAPLVPHGEGEHAVETPGQGDWIKDLGEVGDDLGVALGGEVVPVPAKLFAQRDVVVDLAIEDSSDGAVLVGDGGITSDEVDDRQASLADGRSVPLEHAPGVGPAMMQRADLALDGTSIVRGPHVEGARDPAHLRGPLHTCRPRLGAHYQVVLEH
jgi:hypothetical protein